MGSEIRSDEQAHRVSLGGTNYNVLSRYCLQLYDPVGDPGGTLMLLWLHCMYVPPNPNACSCTTRWETPEALCGCYA